MNLTMMWAQLNAGAEILMTVMDMPVAIISWLILGWLLYRAIKAWRATK